MKHGKKTILAITSLIITVLIILCVPLYLYLRNFAIQDKRASTKNSSTSTLTLEQIKNSEIIYYDERVSLKDGEYLTADCYTVPRGDDCRGIARLGDELTRGEIDGDGSEDAATTMFGYCSGAGTCYTELGIWLNRDGKAQFLSVIPIGYRPEIQNITIQNGIISFEANSHDINSPIQSFWKFTYEFVGGKFVLKEEKPVEDSNTANWKTYEDKKHGFEFKYPEGYELFSTSTKDYFYPDTVIAGAIQVTEEKDKDTNHGIRYAKLSIDVTEPKNGDPASCLENRRSDKKSRIINGHTWYITREDERDSAMAGARGIFSIYQTVWNNKCYTAETFVHWYELGWVEYTDTGKRSTTPKQLKAQADQIQKYDETLYAIFSTFKFTTDEGVKN